ncbi:MAG: fatty acid--CoA ligase family protein [Aquiluna sp.]|nr:fatty acid--CoA ligase family protein [Aquiluna sp.]MCF8546180.1 fatty acid--CoA ligase family protein [Aquiluna sp.]
MAISFRRIEESVFSSLASWARRQPNAKCLSLPEGDFAYEQVHQDVVKLASRLASRGVGQGQYLAVEGDRYFQIIGALAIGALGAASATLPGDLDSKLIVQRHFDYVLAESAAPVLAKIRHIQVDLQGLESGNKGSEIVELAKTDLGLPYRVSFTSGSTGKPKALVGSQRDVLIRGKLAGGNTKNHVTLSFFPLQSSLGLYRVSDAISSGGTYLSIGNLDFTFNQIEKWGVTALTLSPVSLRRFIEDCQSRGKRLQQIELIHTTGAPLEVSLERKAAEFFQCDVQTVYGSVEVGRVAISSTARVSLEDQGPVLKGMTVEIVDDHGNPVRRGEPGFVRLKSPTMADGYLFTEDQDQSSFRDGFFYPGDKGLIALDGRLEVFGRTDEVANLGGVKINLSEVEEYCRKVLDLIECCAFTWNDHNEELQLGLAYTNPNGLDAESVSSTLMMGFASLAPSTYLELERLPLTSNGKPDRQELRRMAQAQTGNV